MPSETQNNLKPILWTLAAAACMELLFLRMHRLYYLKNHAVEFIELALAAGIVYLIALYILGKTRAARSLTILLVFAAIVFRATLWTMEPTLSDDLHRYRWRRDARREGERSADRQVIAVGRRGLAVDRGESHGDRLAAGRREGHGEDKIRKEAGSPLPQRNVVTRQRGQDPGLDPVNPVVGRKEQRAVHVREQRV